MQHNPFRSSDPLTECQNKSNLGELLEMDREYTAKAQSEGKPYYKWDTNEMTELIYKNGCDDVCKETTVWYYIAKWLSLTLKFVKDESIQHYMEEFKKGKIYYTDEYYGKTIYNYMYMGHVPYVYVLYDEYLHSMKMEMPNYIEDLVCFYLDYFNKIHTKIPNDDGTKLIEVSFEEAQKYNGFWISPEEHEEIRKRLDEKMENFLRERGVKL